MDSAINYIKTMLSSCPDVSFARVSGVLVLALLMASTAWSVWVLKQPIPDLPTNWLTLILSLYGVSKTGDVIAAIKSKGGEGE